ncbi:hypothetical protein JTE90_022388 [Oedothorax gibbosus]|uniref:Major facilitator superfamily (MFS) profile domain-containing protein n=1 Tax=Oedothorax gibbosus TaxID=931172 RepID=A0AAV6UMJ4_9ARAC|nr:hypothetical protein JTE90_022388 [Oedothorax gibbosus]
MDMLAQESEDSQYISAMTECKKESLESRKPNCYLPARWVLTFLLFWAMCLEYSHRVCLSVTIVAMINHTALDQASNNDSDLDSNDTCDVQQGVNATAPDEEGDYLWSPSIQGVVLGAYFYGYVCTQVIGGRMSEVVGGKWVIGLSILIGSLLTFITPIAADIGVVAIVIVRAIMGFVHGVCLPTAFAMFAQWAPPEERSTLIALCVIGDHVGTVVTMPLTGYLCEYGFAGGWPSVYYILGILGCVWFVFWVCLAHNRPTDHPRITSKEIDYIQKGHVQMTEDQKLPVPWKSVLTSMPVWSVAIVSFCGSWGHTTLLTKLPTYLKVVLHVPIQKNGLLNSLVYASSCITIFFSAYLSDYFISKKKVSTTNIRKGFEIIGMLGPAFCTTLIPLMRCDRVAAITLLTAAMACFGFIGGGHISIVADMAPHHAASLFGFVNGLGGLSGIFSPLAAGFLLDDAHASVEQWSLVFYLSAGLYMVGGIVFVIWGSAERQTWAKVIGSEKLIKNSSIQNENINSTSKFDIEKKYGSIT